jgi:hypothetical protein
MKTLVLRFLFGAFVATALSLTAWAQTKPGLIKAVKVQGEVYKLTTDGQSVKLTEGAILTESDTVTTGKASSVVLVFMNGSSIKLAQDSKLAVDEFKMDPEETSIKVSTLEREPSVSKTQLSLTYGEMVGEVKHLNRDGGSYFNIKTPVGAAGIRGTTFRIVFRPTGDGKAFNFTLSTAEGVVLFTGTTQGAGGVDVPQNKEVVVTGQIDPVTHQVTSMQVSDVQNISPAAMLQINGAIGDAISQAQQITVFTPTEQQNPPAPPANGPQNGPGTPPDPFVNPPPPNLTPGDGSGGT